MVITVVLLGMVAGIASGIAAVMAGMPIWALAVIYPVGGLACVVLMLSVMFLSMPASSQDAEFTGTAKAN